jgi:isocitrate dehydrogenase kinase/phosphatase
MSTKITDSRLANLGASAIHEAFSAYRQEFDAITRQAKIRFRERHWHGMRADATERLELYKKVVDRVEAQQTVQIKNEQIIVEHAYVERRVIPLNVYLEETDEDAARNVVIDFGRAIKDMAVSNIFPGDILLKNFGVTRHGRVVFYDYDELCPLTSCNFRKLPQALSYDDELSSEPWFYVDENDVFPEEFRNFLGLSESLREVFMQHHADIFEVEYWRRAQKAINAGELPHIFPYERNVRPESH